MVERDQYGYITRAFSGSPWWGEKAGFSHVVGRARAVVILCEVLEAGWADPWAPQVVQALNRSPYPQHAVEGPLAAERTLNECTEGEGWDEGGREAK